MRGKCACLFGFLGGWFGACDYGMGNNEIGGNSYGNGLVG